MALKLAHNSDKERIILVNESALKRSKYLELNKTQEKIIITKGNQDALIFIIKYLNFYSTIEEVPIYDHPLPENVALAELFELEQIIFGDLLNMTNLDQKIVFVKNLIDIAEELDLNVLFEKLSCILCYYMMHSCNETIKEV